MRIYSKIMQCECFNQVLNQDGVILPALERIYLQMPRTILT